MSRGDRVDCRQDILDAALEIFAQKGYDGARVDEIAALGRMPKSTIYYHFEGKINLLEALMESYYKRYEAFLVESLGDDERVEMGARKFLEDNQKLTRVVLIESLKESTESFSIFSFAEGLIQREKEVLKRDSAAISKRLMAEFFLNVIPRAMFTCYKGDWAKHFGKTEEEVNDEFYGIMMEMHGSYLAKLF